MSVPPAPVIPEDENPAPAVPAEVNPAPVIPDEETRGFAPDLAEPTSEGSTPAVLDYSNEVPTSASSTLVAGEKYDPRPGEDSARRRIAYALIGLLSLIVFAMLAFVGFGIVSPMDIKEFSIILGPIVTLVSAATGFYYGTKSNSR